MTKKFYHVLAVMALCLIAIISPSQLQAAVGETFTKDQLKYTVYSEDKVTKTGTVSVEEESREISGDIVIPEYIENDEYTYLVTIIPDNAFDGCQGLTDIVIPNSVTSIGDRAFSGCNLTSIIIPDSVVSIGYSAFSNCNYLTNIVIGNGVTSIDSFAFNWSRSLIRVVIGNGVTSIGGYAFGNCGMLTNITIPDSVTSIEANAFNGCHNLASVYFEGNAPTPVHGAFGNSTTIYYLEGTKGWVDYWGGRPTVECKGWLAQDGIIYIYKSDETAIINGYTEELDSVVIPKTISVDSINYFVTSIGAYTFYNCGRLTNITIPDSINSIGNNAFTYCSSLTSVTIPSSVSYIGYRAFYECSSLASVYFKGDAPETNENGVPFSVPSVIYYRPGSTGWTNPWSGRPATLWIEAPQIEEQPKSHAVLEGDSVTFTVSAEGTAPLNYQWYKDDVAIEEAIREIYTIESVTAEDLGNYKVVVTNTEGEAVSDVAVLSLLQPPTITVNPISVTVDNGTNVVFTVEAQNADSYQWYKDGTAISGATETTYSIEYVKGSDVGTYTAMAINRAGAEKSSPAALSLTQPYRATAELQMVNGFIVGITVTDCGWGYEFEPKVRIKDEFGEGAEAHCIVENGMVTAIILDNPGSGYSEETTVKVGSPFKYVGLKAEVKQIKLTLYLVLGETYQLEACTDLSTHDWKKIGDPFIADEEETEIIVEVLETGRYFRVHEVK